MPCTALAGDYSNIPGLQGATVTFRILQRLYSKQAV